MLTYSFSNIGSDSLYSYLYKCIKNDILNGNLKSGEKLPSKRSFAKNLGISVITIENAYEQLAAEGYIYSIAKKGFFVSDLKDLQGFKVPDKLPETKSDRSASREYVADFTSNKVNKDLFPFTIWAKLIREVLRDSQEALLTSSPGNGIYALRKTIAEHLFAFKGIHVNPEQIIIGAGTENLYSQIVQLLGHDKVYGVEDPGYLKTTAVYEANAVEVKHIPFNRNGINIEELEHEQVSVAHISPSHQFPTGIVTPISKRYELLGWASREADRYIIEDDYDSEFRLTGQPIPTLYSIDTTGRVIYMNTFSKSLTPTLRISYMVLPEKLVQRYHTKLSFYTCPVTTLIQLTLARFIEDGYFEKHLNRMRNFYKRQRDLLIDLISKNELSKYVSVSEENAGPHFLMHLNIPCSDLQLKAILDTHNIKIQALSDFFFNKENKSEQTFLLNYSSLTEEQLHKSVKILNEVICQCNKQQD